MKLYANPSNGRFTLQLIDLIGTKNIAVYTISGQKIYSKSVAENTIQIDLSDHPKGVYFCKVFDDSKNVHNGKIIVK
ncbi:MAG: T9SS type A sorting domain-containing protein [Nonlabens sp.]|uniref:T9SS type A sorting domain-containing protein n=1 Tax=Nonlabens sp. TaxID=1888209 RepID=UPI00321B0DB5